MYVVKHTQDVYTLYVCDWQKSTHTLRHQTGAHTKVRAFQPITDVYFTIYIKSWNVAKRQHERQWLNPKP